MTPLEIILITLALINITGFVIFGIISLQDVERVNAHIVSYLAEAGVRIVSIYVCPHGRGDGCRCIKPNPYFPRKAAQEHGIDLRRSFVIGDHPHDVELATNAGAQGIYVLTGHGVKHRDQMPEEALVVSGIGQAVERILQRTVYFDRTAGGRSVT